MADPERIAARLARLWEIARGPAGGADRPAYSAAEAAAVALVAGWARELGLRPALDPFGNLWAPPEGWDGPLVTAGSHVDTVPDGGRYDGALGTVLGLELVADLRADGAGAPARAGLLVCAAEEAPRFGAGTVGSRLMTGALAPDALHELCDAGGVTAAEALAAYLAELDERADLERIERVPLERVRAHGEVHVALRHGPIELGVVTHVASPRRLRIEVRGESGHAGEVAMADRRDALAAAAEMTLAVERAARDEPRETVATVGGLTVTPGAVSVIAGAAQLLVDMRAIESRSLHRLQDAIAAAVTRIAAARGVAAETVVTRAGEPVEMDPALAQRALAAAAAFDIPAGETWSGAGHDSQHLGAVTPALLLFVPLRGGESHTPQEGADAAEIAWAARVLAAVLGEVMHSPPSLE